MEDLLNITTEDLAADAFKKRGAEVFSLFMKTIKAILVYPTSSRLPQQFKKDLFDSVIALLEETDAVSYKIETDRIFFSGHEVYRAPSKTENFAHTFFRDGVLSFQFEKGLTIEELDTFIELTSRMMRAAILDDDLATLLWEAGFAHISYELMDEMISIETFEYGTDALKSGKIATKSDIQQIFTNEINLDISQADFEVDQSKKKGTKASGYLDTPDSVKDFISRVANYDDEEKKIISDILAQDAAFEYKKYIIDLLFEVLGLESDNAGFQEALELIGKVRNDFVRQADFLSATEIMQRTRELEQGLKNLKDPKLDKIEGFIESFAVSDKIKLIVECFNNNKDVNYTEAANYLSLLPWQAIAPLVGALGELLHFPARRSVCRALETLAVDKVELLAKGIEDPRWYVVRNVVSVLGKINNPKAFSYFKKTIRHPELRVRKETLVSIAKIKSDEAVDFLISALKDEDEKIQSLALAEIVQQKSGKSFAPIEKIITDKKFKDRPVEQIRQLLDAYAQVGGPKAFSLLKELATQRSLMPSEKLERVRDHAVKAMAYVQSNECKALLEKLAGSSSYIARIRSSGISGSKTPCSFR